MDHDTNKTEQRGVIDLIADLKRGHLSCDAITLEQRRDVVEYLCAEGVGTAECARMLGVAARTVRRDLEHIRDRNALKADQCLADRIAGELVTEARACMARIRRATREKGASHAVRVDGERAVFQILDSLTVRLQSLGHLPMASHRVKADLTHRLGEAPQLDALKDELERLSVIATQDAALTGELTELKQLAETASDLEQHTPPHSQESSS